MLRLTLLVALILTACADDSVAMETQGTTGTSSESSTGTSAEPTSTGTSAEPTSTGGTTAEPVARELVVPEDFVLCSLSLIPALEQGRLFRAKARVTLGAGHYDVSDAIADDENDELPTAPFTIPLGIEHQLDLAAPRAYMITGEEARMDRHEDAVLAPQWSLWPMPGYQTLRLYQYFSETDDAPTPWAPNGRPALGLMVSDPADEGTLELGKVAAADFSLWAGFGGGLAPCAGPGVGTRTDVFYLEGGSIEFDLRKEIQRGGTMLRAAGQIDGVAIDASDFWDLEYGVTAVDGGFDHQPYYAVRFPQTPEGECGLWVGWWAQEERLAAFFVDCALTDITREVAVLSYELGDLTPAGP